MAVFLTDLHMSENQHKFLSIELTANCDQGDFVKPGPLSGCYCLNALQCIPTFASLRGVQKAEVTIWKSQKNQESLIMDETAWRNNL